MIKATLVGVSRSPGFLPERRLTVSERVYYQLKGAIAHAEFPRGSPLVIRDLAARFKVSRTPVVEAIRRLERDGLIIATPKWGATVKEWSWQEIEDAAYIRRALEAEAATLFVMRATDLEKKQLVQLNEMYNDSVSADDWERSAGLHVEMHLHIARSTHLPRLYELIQNSNIETTTIIGLATKQAELNEYHAEWNLGCHDALVQKLLGQNPEAARAAMLEHISAFLERLAELRGLGHSRGDVGSVNLAEQYPEGL